MKVKATGSSDAAGIVLITILISNLIAILGWITHVVVCIKSASWFLLALGCFIFPIGVIHGIGSWFGLFQ